MTSSWLTLGNHRSSRAESACGTTARSSERRGKGHGASEAADDRLDAHVAANVIEPGPSDDRFHGVPHGC